MRLRLSSGAYTARSIIAAAQRSVNLYAEKGPGNAIVDAASGAPIGNPEAGGVTSGLSTLYQTPGLTSLATLPAPNAARGLYWANSGTLFYVAGSTLYNVHADWTMTTIGTIAAGTTPVSMADNGITLVLVDGTANGYQVDLASLVFSAINDTPYPSGNAPTAASTAVYGFYGADRVAMIDGFMLFNRPGTAQFYSTYNNEIVFDSLYIASKNAFADNLVAVVVSQRVIWLIGERTSELWSDVGAADFPFALMASYALQHGCCAKYSVAQINESIFFLSQDQGGANIVVQTRGYAMARISTHAIEVEWARYATTSDAQGSTFQHGGHVLYQITFPTADKTWRYDETSGEWHEAVWSDTNGDEHRHRAACVAWAYGRTVGADWETGALYAVDPAALTDAGAPIQRIRDFPHVVNDGNRVFYQNLVLDMQAGQSVGTTDPPLVDPPDLGDTSPQVLLSWSDDRGRTFGNPVSASLGATGEYLRSLQFVRLGMARDRVFRVRWSAAVDTALQGAFITLKPVSS